MFSIGALREKLSHFDLKSWVEFWFHQWLNFLSQNDSIISLGALREKNESFWPKKLNHFSWVETKTFELKKKLLI